MKYRIGIIADAMDEHYAGVHTYAHELIVNLPRLDPDSEYTFIHQVPNAFFDGRREILVPLNRANPLDIVCRKFVRLPAALERERFDLVHDLFHFPPFAFRRLMARTVATIHDLTPVLFPQWHPWATVLSHRLALPLVMRRADCVIADSQSTANDIQRVYGQCHPEVRTVYLGTRGLPLPGPAEESGPFILAVGTLEPRKNLPVLVEAYETLRRRGRHEKLVIIGKKGWDYAPSLRRIAASPFVADIKVKGFVTAAALAWHYQAASAFAYPSLYEGFGLPVLEAMSGGCPVVTSNVSSLPEVVGDAGIQIAPGDVGALADGLLRILTDARLARELAERGRARARAFTWERTAERTLAVYREILGTAPVGAHAGGTGR